MPSTWPLLPAVSPSWPRPLSGSSGAAHYPARAWLDMAWSPRTLPIGKVQLLMQSLPWRKVCVAEQREALEAEQVGAGLEAACKGTLGT